MHRTKQKSGTVIHKDQLAEDQIADQISMKEYLDLFTGRENNKSVKETP